MFTINVIIFIIEEIICWHWYIRKTYQTSLYRFNAFHELNLWRICFRRYILKLEFLRWKLYTFIHHYEFLRVRTAIMDYTITKYWYNSCWFLWSSLTYYLYYNSKFRDLGPSHQVFDYHDEIKMGFYLTMGLRLTTVWIVWTYIADIVFKKSIFFFLNKFFFVEYIRVYWYIITLYSCIEMHLINILSSVYSTNTFIWNNYSNLELITKNYKHLENSKFLFTLSQHIVRPEIKSLYLWFPWTSFFNYLTVLGVLYILTLLAIYNSDNVYYVVLYTIFVIFLFSANLVILDLDIFAGLLLLIESVVVLMLFFLIIYLTPNTTNQFKNNKLKIYFLVIFIISILSVYSYPSLGMYFFNSLSTPIYFYDDYYEALNDLHVNDLMGLFISLYLTDSLVLLVIGLFLLIASIICVVLVSFFTKLRNSSFKNFLSIFTIVKTCYSYIFLRKQNLSKQGKSNSSTRIFKKQTFDTHTHTEYREKYEAFEQKKKDAKKSNII